VKDLLAQTMQRYGRGARFADIIAQDAARGARKEPA
jgi:hypothetical protein